MKICKDKSFYSPLKRVLAIGELDLTFNIYINSDDDNLNICKLNAFKDLESNELLRLINTESIMLNSKIETNNHIFKVLSFMNKIDKRICYTEYICFVRKEVKNPKLIKSLIDFISEREKIFITLIEVGEISSSQTNSFPIGDEFDVKVKIILNGKEVETISINNTSKESKEESNDIVNKVMVSNLSSPLYLSKKILNFDLLLIDLNHLLINNSFYKVLFNSETHSNKITNNIKPKRIIYLDKPTKLSDFFFIYKQFDYIISDYNDFISLLDTSQNKLLSFDKKLKHLFSIINKPYARELLLLSDKKIDYIQYDGNMITLSVTDKLNILPIKLYNTKAYNEHKLTFSKNKYTLHCSMMSSILFYSLYEYDYKFIIKSESILTRKIFD